jgi:hypothetical protein
MPMIRPTIMPMIRRRQLLLGGMAAAVARSARAATPALLQAPAYEILVGGPRGGRMDRWSKAAAIGLAPGLLSTAPATGASIPTRLSGGIDGVTAANRLQALVVPDGHTAAMLPGLAIIAYLAADLRVHFQIGNWVPVLAGISSAVLVVRGGTARLAAAQPLRVAADSPESGDLAGLLSLARLGVAAAPIFGLHGFDAKAHAFAVNEADAMLVYGEDVPAASASLGAEGGIPVCSLTIAGQGGAGEAGVPVRDPAFPALPTVDELALVRRAPPLPPPLNAAFQAAIAATLIDFVLVLPHLTAPASIALWRSAAAMAVIGSAMQSAAEASSIRLGAGSGAEAALTSLNLNASALLALQSWLVGHFDWHPS